MVAEYENVELRAGALAKVLNLAGEAINEHPVNWITKDERDSVIECCVALGIDPPWLVMPK